MSVSLQNLTPGYAIHSRVGKDNKHPEGYEVVRWPEFLAFAKRLGINLALPFRGLSIRIPFEGECVEITQTYIADDINQPEAKTPFDGMVQPLDVTTAHNEHYRTYVGKPDNDQPDRAPDEIWGSLNFTNLNIGDSWAKFLDTWRYAVQNLSGEETKLGADNDE